MTERMTLGESPKEAPEQPEWRNLNWNKLGWGLALVVLGLLFTLDRFTDVGDFFRLWPMVLAVLGLVRLVSAKSGDQVRTGLWLLGTASWLLINFFGVAGFYWHNSWPLWPMMAGIIHLLVPEKNDSRLWGLIPLGIGVWLLAVTRGIAGLNWQNSWPLILIFVGLSIVIQALVPKRAGKEKGDAN